MTFFCVEGKVIEVAVVSCSQGCISAPALSLVYWSDHIPLMVALNSFLCLSDSAYQSYDISCDVLLQRHVSVDVHQIIPGPCCWNESFANIFICHCF